MHFIVLHIKFDPSWISSAERSEQHSSWPILVTADWIHLESCIDWLDIVHCFYVRLSIVERRRQSLTLSTGTHSLPSILLHLEVSQPYVPFCVFVPTMKPDMNYISAVYAVVVIIVVIDWFARGKKVHGDETHAIKALDGSEESSALASAKRRAITSECSHRKSLTQTSINLSLCQPP
jgi:hypothetical protein